MIIVHFELTEQSIEVLSRGNMSTMPGRWQEFGKSIRKCQNKMLAHVPVVALIPRNDPLIFILLQP